MEYVQEAEGLKNSSSFLNRAENTYLAILRAATLTIATLFIFYAGWLAISGLYSISRDASRVTEAPVEVTPEEITAVETKGAAETATAKPGASSSSEQQSFYKTFSAKYLKLFRRSFEPYRQASDNPISPETFDKNYLQTGGRLAAIESGALNFEQDKTDLEKLFAVMSKAATLPATKTHLVAYQKAKRVRNERSVKKTRAERYCAYYGYYIDECIVYDTRSVPYTDTVVSMDLPKGVLSHSDLFGAYQDNFMRLLSTRRQESQSGAESERRDILAANVQGRVNLWTAVQVAGGFLALMFLFLLVAIERHQRKIAAHL